MIAIKQAEKKSAQTAATVLDTNKSTHSCIQDTIDRIRSQALDLSSDLSFSDIPISDVVSVLYMLIENIEDETTIPSGWSEDATALLFFRRIPPTISALRILLRTLETAQEEINRHADRAFGISKALRDLQTEITNP
ncbi:MAG: hypothetical protein MR295_02275 [Ruminococcus bromii]|nr:hypothetical protein [Ruminococcus bromii]